MEEDFLGILEMTVSKDRAHNKSRSELWYLPFWTATNGARIGRQTSWEAWKEDLRQGWLFIVSRTSVPISELLAPALKIQALRMCLKVVECGTCHFALVKGGGRSVITGLFSCRLCLSLEFFDVLSVLSCLKYMP